MASNHEFKGDKVALLVLPGEDFNQAEFFEIYSRNRGNNVEAFTNFEDAIQWFYEDRLQLGLVVENSRLSYP